ncbi:MAG: transcription elongation factor subunit Spt4 [Candidatus Bathyarchaeia archaeon]
MLKEKACRNCRLLVYGSVCPNCKNTFLTEDYSGLLIIIDPENSEIAKKAGITKAGRYALKVR